MSSVSRLPVAQGGYNAGPTPEPAQPKVAAVTQAGAAAPAGPAHEVNARQLLQGAQRFDPNNPVARYLDSVKRELAAKGLPTSAEGVRVFITGEHAGGDHSRKIAQLISGPDGLARGCSLGVISWKESFAYAECFENDLQARYYGPLLTAVDAGACSLFVLGDIGVTGLSVGLARRRQDIQAVREKVEDKDGTTIVSQSYASNITVEAKSLAERFLKSGARGELRKDLEAELGRPLRPGLEDLPAVRELFAKYIDVALNCSEAEAAQEYGRYKSALEAEVQLASALGIIVFVAAGNDYAKAWISEHATEAAVGTGIVAVAAADIGDPDMPDDDRVASFSAPGDIAAPGVRIPTGEGDVNGTSYAAPLAAATAALMVAANPEVRPEDILDIFRAPGSTRDLPGERDGAGLIDMVASVEAAARRRNNTQLGMMSLWEARFGTAKSR